MTDEISQTESGMFSLFIHNGSNRLLPAILNQEIPWVWVLGHRPNRTVEWWDTQLPLSRDGTPQQVRARDVAFDLVFRTEEFLGLYEEFLDHGIALFQSTEPMPNTLLLEMIEEKALDEVLKQNGVYLQFYLPHAFETCQVKCWDRHHLEMIRAEQADVADPRQSSGGRS